VTPEELAAKVADDRRRQGLPDHIEDETVLARVLALLDQAERGGGGADAP
jgi:hypothetical protein